MTGEYKIRSKSHELLFIGSSNDIEKSIAWHKFHLIKRIHPNPILTNHVLKFGFSDLEFISNPDQPEPNQSGIMKKERRKRIEPSV